MLEASQARKDEDFFTQRDWRADGGARRVRVTSSDIVIARRFGGVKMSITVPVPAYQGVLLDLVDGEDGAPCYRLLLAHRDRDLDVALAQTADEGEAAGDWAYWAARLGLPRLAATETGDFAIVDQPALPSIATKRRGASAVRRRRPTFLARRKTGAPVDPGATYAGEREIISYE